MRSSSGGGLASGTSTAGVRWKIAARAQLRHPPSSSMAFRIGAMLNRYRIDGVLGQGRTGIVYRGFDTVIERTVAIKCLRADFQKEAAPKESSRLVALLDEAKVIGQLNHPHVTAVYDLGTTRGNSFIVM